jgi:hypothetical protein
LALALVLAASAAFADVPGNIKDIEGLPEMPEVPTMTTSVSGTTETIVVSEKLNWLNWINNWNWNQIEWSEDGLTGTFSLAGLKSQPGYGHWLWSSDEFVVDTNYWMYDKGEKVDPEILGDYLDKWAYDYYDENGELKYNHGHYHEWDTVKSCNPGYVFSMPSVDWEDWDGDGEWNPYVHAEDVYVESPEDDEFASETLAAVTDALKEDYSWNQEIVDQIDEYAGYSYLYNGAEAIVTKGQNFSFGTYDLGGKVGWAPIYNGMAFDGEAANGAHVRYDRFGNVISITSTLTGVNFLNMENEPVKTEVTWGVSKTQFGRKFYIASIKAYIDDETAVEAGFASGGKLLKVK